MLAVASMTSSVLGLAWPSTDCAFLRSLFCCLDSPTLQRIISSSSSSSRKHRIFIKIPFNCFSSRECVQGSSTVDSFRTSQSPVHLNYLSKTLRSQKNDLDAVCAVDNQQTQLCLQKMHSISFWIIYKEQKQENLQHHSLCFGGNFIFLNLQRFAQII